VSLPAPEFSVPCCTKDGAAPAVEISYHRACTLVSLAIPTSCAATIWLFRQSRFKIRVSSAVLTVPSVSPGKGVIV
jgi:hypothetical protein